MIKACIKTVIFAILLLSLSGQAASANTKVYQYDGKLPFVQMMLNMMVAMGILDRLPANGMYGSSGFSNRYGNNPYMNSAMSRSPWSSPARSGLEWGSPSWGVLPVESYTMNRYPTPGVAPYWSEGDMNGWVNEPWETSNWNPGAATANQPSSSGAEKQSPLAGIVQPRQPQQQPPPQQQQSSKPPSQLSPLRNYTGQQRNISKPITRSRQKPCVTDFCGLKKPDLNGLWVTQNGEMLGIKNQRYLWGDGRERYLSGQIKIQNEYLLANVDGHNRLLRFKYKLAGNHLLTMQPDGKIREFTRLQPGQYNYGNQRSY